MYFLQTGNPPSFPTLTKATTEHPNNTALVPQTNSVAAVNLVKQLLIVSYEAGLRLNFQLRNI